MVVCDPALGGEVEGGVWSQPGEEMALGVLAAASPALWEGFREVGARCFMAVSSRRTGQDTMVVNWKREGSDLG